ncbi:hypothetical protein [Olsenella uli]|uniref:hypothetical protein n=1 Tax=Olsenella uli TaxID=133926 RepID=UPI00241FC5B6|nr:hypothetical protein [Olsenella uli]
MPTSDERREVAAGLRELRHRTYYREEIVESITDALSIADPVNTFREPEDVYELLADLIDPTCTMRDAEWDNGECTWGCICSNCHAHLEHEHGRNLRYCPRCGARVVSGDE